MLEELNKICKVESDIDLTQYNTYRIHSVGKYIIFPTSFEELINILNIVKNYNYKYLILGNGSNVILPDYYDGLVIKVNNLNNYEIKNDMVYAECGCMINKIANELVNKGLSGLEWATGIPGSIGGCVYNNAGAYNSSMSDILEEVTFYDGQDIKTLKCDELDFEYRDSIFKKNKELVVLSCNFKVSKSNKEELKNIVLDRTNRRMQTQDLSHPSCGSVFRNPVEAPAGKLIEDSGFKGYFINDAMVSKIHANFIINNGNAKQEDIVKLINEIKEKIKKQYNINLILEQEIIK